MITAQLRWIAERHPVGEKLLVTAGAGTAQEAVTLRDRLAAEGTPWIGFREATVADMAGRLAGPILAEEGFRPLPSTVQLFLVQELVEEELLREPGGYFAGLDSTAAVLRVARAALEDLRGADLGPDDLEPGAFVSPAKGRALRRLLAAYIDRLETGGWVDGAGVIRRALAVLERDGARRDTGPVDVLCVLGDARLTALEARLLDRWPAEERLLLGWPGDRGIEPGPTRARSRLGGFDWADRTPADAEPHPAGRILLPGTADAEAEDRIELALTVGAENEVREALRRAAARGLPLDRVELVYTDADRYRDLVHAEAERLDLACTFAEGLPVKLTRPGQALRLFYDWILEDFDDRVLRRVLRSGLIDLRRAGEETEALLPSQAAALLREARIGSGRERYATALDRLRHRIETRISEREEEGRAVDPLRRRLGLVDRLAALVHPDRGLLWELVPDRGEVPVAELAHASVSFLEELAVRHGELEPPAHESLARRLREVADEVTAELPRGRAVRLLRDEIELHPISRSGPRPGRLHVAPLGSGGLAGRELTVVVGLDESRFPGAGIEDPFLLDRERRRLSPELPLRGRAPTDRVEDLVATLAEASGEVLLTASVMEVADGRELYPASAFLRAYRVSAGQPRAGFEACLRALHPPTSFVPRDDEALEETEAWLTRRDAAGYAEAVRAGRPLLAAGHAAALARRSPDFTAWDGRVSSAAGREDPRTEGDVVSASRLETLLVSPYRYFLRYVLEVEPVEELDYEPGRWLDPMQRGRLLHDLFRRFMEELGERGERPDESRHAGRLKALLEDLLERWRGRVPPPSEGAYRREIRELRRTAAIFLRSESELAEDAEGVGFEVRFGFGDATEGLGSPDPVPVEVGPAGTLRLRGSIDRVDRAPDGSYRVWDYKTGSTGGHDRGDPLGGGSLQWLLYGLALEELLERRGEDAVVATSGYLFPSTRGHGQRFAYAVTPDDVRRAGELLERHLALVDAGLFPHATDHRDCRWCDYRLVCGDPEARATEAKAAMQRIAGTVDTDNAAAPGSDEIGESGRRLARWHDG